MEGQSSAEREGEKQTSTCSGRPLFISILVQQADARARHLKQASSTIQQTNALFLQLSGHNRRLSPTPDHHQAGALAPPGSSSVNVHGLIPA